MFLTCLIPSRFTRERNSGSGSCGAHGGFWPHFCPTPPRAPNGPSSTDPPAVLPVCRGLDPSTSDPQESELLSAPAPAPRHHSHGMIPLGTIPLGTSSPSARALPWEQLPTHSHSSLQPLQKPTAVPFPASTPRLGWTYKLGKRRQAPAAALLSLKNPSGSVSPLLALSNSLLTQQRHKRDRRDSGTCQTKICGVWASPPA